MSKSYSEKKIHTKVEGTARAYDITSYWAPQASECIDSENRFYTSRYSGIIVLTCSVYPCWECKNDCVAALEFCSPFQQEIANIRLVKPKIYTYSCPVCAQGILVSLSNVSYLFATTLLHNIKTAQCNVIGTLQLLSLFSGQQCSIL